jgi:hypothetical protein
MQEAIARHGKPEAVRTDRGGGLLSKELGAYLEAELIDHVVGRAYRPAGRRQGRVARGHRQARALGGGALRRLGDGLAPARVLRRRLQRAPRPHGHRRAHLGRPLLRPGRRVLAHIDAVSRRRHGALAMRAEDGSPLEELREHALEVLRLVIVDGRMELRFWGSRVILGSVTR